MTDLNPDSPVSWRDRLRGRRPAADDAVEPASPAEVSAEMPEPADVEPGEAASYGKHLASDQDAYRRPVPGPASRDGIQDFALLLAAAVVGALLLIMAIVVVVVALTARRADDRAAPPPPVPTVDKDTSVFDDFERPDGQSLGKPRTGSPWSFIGAAWGIKGHEARIMRSTGGTPTIALTVASSSDGRVEVTIAKMGDNAGLIFRYHNLANYWQLVSAPRFGTFVLSKAVDGKLTPIGSAGLVGTEDGTTVAVVLDGPKITILVNDVQVKTFTDPTLKDERMVGLVGLADKDLRTRFDNFLVSLPPTPLSTAPSGN